MKIAWLHPDCLNMEWCSEAPRAVFVFDDEFLAAAGWGLKRIQFVYETLLALPVEIHRGPTIETLLSLAPSAIVTIDTPDPWLRERFADLQSRLPLEVLPAPVFVDLAEGIDLKRFSRYWNKAGKLLLG